MCKVKVKVHTLDIAPLSSESSLQKRSSMARRPIFKGSEYRDGHCILHVVAVFVKKESRNFAVKPNVFCHFFLLSHDVKY